MVEGNNQQPEGVCGDHNQVNNVEGKISPLLFYIKEGVKYNGINAEREDCIKLYSRIFS